MQPGVVHLVFTLEDSVCVGGHFYMFESLRRSLHSGVQEALLGQTNTNTEHLGSEEILYRLLTYVDCNGNIIKAIDPETWEQVPFGMLLIFLAVALANSLMKRKLNPACI
jgi:hypothetical protein